MCACTAVLAAVAVATPLPGGDSAQKISIPGIGNAAQVSPILYRGAQPDAGGYAQLHQMGIDIVVDFRDSGSVSREKALVEGQGMRFVSIPWNAIHDPSPAVILSFFSLLRDNPGKKIFVHCKAGADRTGTMVALYRIVENHWSADQAVNEMKDFHYHSFVFAHLSRYVRAFPATLSANPSLAVAASAVTAGAVAH